MTTVFLLYHSYDLGKGEADDKLIGVYSYVRPLNKLKNLRRCLMASLMCLMRS